MPSEEEMEEGLKNLAKHDNKVDYIITHCASTDIQEKIDEGPWHLYVQDILTDYLKKIEKKVQYEHWYFVTFHTLAS